MVSKTNQSSHVIYLFYMAKSITQDVRIRLLPFNDFFYQLCIFNKGFILTFPAAFEALNQISKCVHWCQCQYLGRFMAKNSRITYSWDSSFPVQVNVCIFHLIKYLPYFWLDIPLSNLMLHCSSPRKDNIYSPLPDTFSQNMWPAYVVLLNILTPNHC